VVWLKAVLSALLSLSHVKTKVVQVVAVAVALSVTHVGSSYKKIKKRGCDMPLFLCP
jgi:hypothetical protein